METTEKITKAGETMRLLTIENAKTSKGARRGYLTGILYLAPHRISGYTESLCPNSTAACRAACLYSAGRGQFKSIQEARIIKTIHFFEARDAFIDQLQEDIEALKRQAARLRLKPCVRLNGTSDIDWQFIAPRLFVLNSDVQFYDYTADVTRVALFQNYDLTYSKKEHAIDSNNRVAVVFAGKTLPSNFLGRKVIDGDETDLRFLDSQSVIVGLRAKGKAKRDLQGFSHGN
jgi:hypothetical protein